ncbi:TPA: hypothetical protein ACH3X2_002616 [Trebouxia sp. C0005]
MRLLKRFTKGAAIFEQRARSGNAATSPGVQWPVYVYTDVPSAAHAACEQGHPTHGLQGAAVIFTAACPKPTPSDERLAMLFEGDFQGEAARLEAPVLLDSGASSNFVSRCRRRGPKYSQPAPSTAAGNHLQLFYCKTETGQRF